MKHLFAALLSLSVAGAAHAASGDEGPFVLKENSFVCVSPEAYAEAQTRLTTAASRYKLAKQMTAEKLCIMVDEEDIEDMMAPFVKVTDRTENLIKVQYEVEFYKRIRFLHRAFARVVFKGWTHSDQLIPRADIGKRE